MLRILFNSDFFKEAAYKKMKSPVEVVVGTLKFTQDLQGPDPRLESVSKQPGYMGQDILDPPSVEGWHTGKEWINSGALVNRVNFVAERVGNTDLPGVRSIIDRVASRETAITPDALVDRCLDQMGPLEVSVVTRKELLDHAERDGEDADLPRRVADMLALIAATREDQFG